ncbi:fimbrillin family protein [Porphyromonadaceae bacterium OttesenSCG-928-L07]|nr:fimbrillin family protein [Porphyromonadaceae bacterium OttesenSCG-928-L07]MDL2251395.1 fimbrillin family protein [Odoribacter sp. OttesenSCG-928-J03]MDL2330620.1 fimbrillin family protein [Odoribacter sp. OttesenSCG-928-A06]
MKPARIVITGLLIGLGGMLSCSKSDTPVQHSGTETVATFSAGITTRAEDANWHSGDEIGITVLKHGENSNTHPDYTCNRKHVTSNTAGHFSPDSGCEILYPLNGDTVDFIGYYPFTNAIGEDLTLALNVSDQSNLPSIDLMTFDRVCGKTKNDPHVAVEFKHKLVKLSFNFRKFDNTTSMNVSNIRIQGMHTCANFNILTCELSDRSNMCDMDVTVQNDKACALVLPREAAEGVTFIITMDDDLSSPTTYIVDMRDDLHLVMGTHYKLNISLLDKQTPPSMSVKIAEWSDGGEHEFNDNHPEVTIATPGITTGFSNLDQITLYYEDKNADTQSTEYTYNGSKWLPATPLYWEDIGDGESETVAIRAEYIRTAAATGQLPEVMLANVSATRFDAVHFDLTLVPAKIEFILSSSTDGDKFTASELESATITINDLLTNYTLSGGVFTKGTDNSANRGNISIGTGRGALVIPQSKSGQIASVTIKGGVYKVETSSPIALVAGKVCTLKVKMTKTSAVVSASYTDWTSDGTDRQFTPIALTGSTTNFKAGETLHLYYDNTTPAKELINEFTFQNNGTWIGTGGAKYWEDLDGFESHTTFNFYAVSTLSQAPSGSNQMNDVMYAKHQSVPKLGGVNLAFSKKTSKVVVELTTTEDDTKFTSDELNGATLSLPGYKIGGQYNGIDFVSGTTTATITPTRPELSNPKWYALIEPQTIAKGSVIFRIIAKGRTYDVKAKTDGEETPFTFEEGKTHTFSIKIAKNAIASFSASYSDWVPGGETNLETGLE